MLAFECGSSSSSSCAPSRSYFWTGTTVNSAPSKDCTGLFKVLESGDDNIWTEGTARCAAAGVPREDRLQVKTAVCSSLMQICESGL